MRGLFRTRSLFFEERSGRQIATILDADLAIWRAKSRLTFAQQVAQAAATIGIPGPHVHIDGEAIATFAGVDSPFTQASGISEETDLEAMHTWYGNRVREWEAIISTSIGVAPVNALLKKGATARAFVDRLLLEIPEIRLSALDPQISIREVKSAGDKEHHGRLMRAGFAGISYDEELGEFDRLLIAMPDQLGFIASIKGKDVGGATLAFRDGVACLTGASTLPEYRGQGVQTALLKHRLRVAAKESYFAMASATPGTSSHRNFRREGFQIVGCDLELGVPTS